MSTGGSTFHPGCAPGGFGVYVTTKPREWGPRPEGGVCEDTQVRAMLEERESNAPQNRRETAERACVRPPRAAPPPAPASPARSPRRRALGSPLPLRTPRGGLFSPFEIFFFAFHFHEFDLDAPGHDVL